MKSSVPDVYKLKLYVIFVQIVCSKYLVLVLNQKKIGAHEIAFVVLSVLVQYKLLEPKDHDRRPSVRSSVQQPRQGQAIIFLVHSVDGTVGI